MITHPRFIGAVVGVIVVALILGGVAAFILINNTNTLISSGKTPAAVAEAKASSEVINLVCAFLSPALTEPVSVSHLLPSERKAILKDCPKSN